MNEEQRVALIAFAQRQRGTGGKENASFRAYEYSNDRAGRLTAAICNLDEEPACASATSKRNYGCICKSAVGAKVYGYYAKAGLRTLTFCTRIQRRLADAVQDRAVLSRIIERMQREGPDKDLASAAWLAVRAVLADEGVEEHEFLRSVTVTFYAHHWLGRGLIVHRPSLDKALEAWDTLKAARGVPLFKGARATAAYTFERDCAQWKRLRRAFVELQVKGGARRADVESRLAAAEASRGPARLRRAALYQQQLQPPPERSGRKMGRAAVDDAALLQRLERVVEVWVRTAAKQAERSRRAAAKEQMRCRAFDRKRRWDGKEAYADFLRRVRARVGAA